jgi:hypothetical protein
MAKCEKVQICNLATSFQVSRSSRGNESLVDSFINARVEMAQTTLVAVPTLTISSSSVSHETQMARTGELGHVYVGSGAFLEVGMHAGVIVVGQQPCDLKTLDFSVECRTGFMWNGRRCSRHADQSVCAMTTITLRQNVGPALLFDHRVKAQIGSKLAFAVKQPHLSSCHVEWVPVPQASRSVCVRNHVRLDFIGKYIIQGHCVSQDSCLFSRFGQFTMICPPGKQAVGRLCKHVQLDCTASFALDAGRCKRKPVLTLSLSSSNFLLVEVEKLDSLHSTASVIIDAKLTAGDFSLDWTVLSAADAWIDHTNGRGRISPIAPVSSANLTISARGLPDYSAGNGDLRTIVRFQSRLSDATQRAIVSGFEGQAASLSLRMRVISKPRLTPQSLRLLSKSEASFAVEWTEHDIVDDDIPTNIPWGNKVFIKLNVTDIDGLPIHRQIDLFAGLADSTNAKFKNQDGTSIFSVEYDLSAVHPRPDSA